LDLALTVVPCVRQALTELRSGDLLKQFLKFDEDCSGKLSQKEMKELARGMGLDTRMMEVEGGDQAEVDFETFQEMIVSGREQLERKCREKERLVQEKAGFNEPRFQELRRDIVQLFDVFMRYDLDGSESLSKTELMMMLQESGLAPRGEQEKVDMQVIFADHEHAEASEINLNDFVEIVLEIRRYRQEKSKEQQQDLFKKYDRDHSEELTCSEVSKLLADLHLTPINRTEQEQIASLICSIDQDGSGVLDFPEFQELCQRIDERLRAFRYEEEMDFAMRLGFTEVQMRELRQVFTRLDQDASEKLDAHEVRIGLIMMGKQVSDKVFQDTFESLDTDGSGEFDFMEFLQFMKLIIDQVGAIGNQEEHQKFAQRPRDLETRVLRRVLEYFRLAKHYVQSLSHEELVELFCVYMNVKPETHLHTTLGVDTIGKLYEAAQAADSALQVSHGG
jgi:Ca2+-binding EF-hand superfamily protein